MMIEFNIIEGYGENERRYPSIFNTLYIKRIEPFCDDECFMAYTGLTDSLRLKHTYSEVVKRIRSGGFL